MTYKDHKRIKRKSIFSDQNNYKAQSQSEKKDKQNLFIPHGHLQNTQLEQLLLQS